VPANQSVPQRTCVGCRRREAVTNLVRLVVIDGVATVDVNRTLPGRGAHVHPVAACVELAVTRKAVARAFREPVEVATLLADVVSYTSPLSPSSETGA